MTPFDAAEPWPSEMPFVVHISDRAWADIDQRVEYLVQASQSIDVGIRFLDAVEATTTQLADAPHQRPLSIHRVNDSDQLRHIALPGFPNDLLFYEISNAAVTILRHFHGAMNIRQRMVDEPEAG